MLRKLLIKNYAIINELEIDFNDHLNVLTGETGAGKSIILGALALLLGERVDSTFINNAHGKSIIEAIFTMNANNEVKEFLNENSFDIYDEVIIRREIQTNGKSRAFINDTPATLKNLSQLSTYLVDLHQQFDNLQLNETAFQYEVIDLYAGISELSENYKSQYKNYLQIKKDLISQKEVQAQRVSEQDYLTFQLNELESADFRENEIEKLEEQFNKLENKSQIVNILNNTLDNISQNEDNQIDRINYTISQLQQLERLGINVKELLQRLHSILEELKDINRELDNIASETSTFDTIDKESLESRLNLGFKLLKKHNLKNTDELIEYQHNIEDKLVGIQSLDSQIAALEKSLKVKQSELESLAAQLYKKRKEQLPIFIKKLEQLLAKVGMPNTKVKVEIAITNNLNTNGYDSLEMLIDTNNTNRFLPINKVASGGELSRLMLCIKSLVNEVAVHKTLIFDEVDSAISGEAAKQVALLIKSLSNTHQIIVITHQAQMVAMSDQHLNIYKKENPDTKVIETHIEPLNQEESIHKIAQMIDGNQPSKAAIQNAREMVLTK